VEVNSEKVLVVVPAFKTANQILETVTGIRSLGLEVLVVDDACPEGSGEIIGREFAEDRLTNVITHEQNQGVGGAMKTGFAWALENDFEIIVKIDGDGQMDPALVPELIKPLIENNADFSKGNRFESPRMVRQMPFIRLLGNGFLSLFSKISTGYWSVNDPTNGFIAIKKETLAKLEPELLADSYFFESDLLFRLAIVRARISEMPMAAVYGDEKSSLKIMKVLWTFPFLHFRNLIKRIVYNYYIRDWSIGSIELPIGLVLMTWGAWFGLSAFEDARAVGETVTAGQAVATAIGIILGFQLLLSFISHDIQTEPRGFQDRTATH
jgi:glycosyltransferase involved in cell wall biosynthesis